MPKRRPPPSVARTLFTSHGFLMVLAVCAGALIVRRLLDAGRSEWAVWTIALLAVGVVWANRRLGARPRRRPEDVFDRPPRR